ncbi:hypothetical protein I0Q91_04780 [Halanaerobiaceae bacterium Z-7014]|uniref:Uncharacterized protein n=1 Tax=Halonatronomonas betaini TaxID=2778430 RepID=A0A931AP90_9FIRM|nr:hypothetical protein [Halonatronomonas betaini]MBF8436387.1 hypothetical protein [Halonatronomonas betaini]
MLKMTKMQKAIILGLVLALVVFSAAACGVDEEELEEMEEMDEDPIEDDFGFELDYEADMYASVNSSAIAM